MAPELKKLLQSSEAARLANRLLWKELKATIASLREARSRVETIGCLMSDENFVGQRAGQCGSLRH